MAVRIATIRANSLTRQCRPSQGEWPTSQPVPISRDALSSAVMAGRAMSLHARRGPAALSEAVAHSERC